MYKYKKHIKKEDRILLIYYYLGILRVKEYKDNTGKITLYGKYIFYNPLFWLIFITIWIILSIGGIIKNAWDGIREIYEINTENSNKGMNLVTYKEDPKNN